MEPSSLALDGEHVVCELIQSDPVQLLYNRCL